LQSPDISSSIILYSKGISRVIGVDVGVGEGMGEGVAVGVGVSEGMGEGVAVGVGVSEGMGEGVDIGGNCPRNNTCWYAKMVPANKINAAHRTVAKVFLLILRTCP
jgi:hypothetical protein